MPGTAEEEIVISVAVEDDTKEGMASVEKRMGGLAEVGTAAGAAGGLAFAAAMSSAMDLSSAESTLENSFGFTTEQAAQAGKAAGDVYQKGFGESMQNVTSVIGEINSSIGDVTKMTEEQLGTMTESALAFSKTFEQETGDATAAVGQLIKTGMVKDATEGFDLITKAMQGVPANLRDDMLPTIQEFSVQFKKLGLDGPTAMGLLSQGLKGGAMDAAAVSDAIKEFSILAVEGSDTAAESFKALGLDADKMVAQIAKGGPDAQAGLQAVLDGLRKVKDPAEQAQIAVTLFGSGAEDLGSALYALNPATAAAEGGLNNAAGSAKKLSDSMEASPAQQLEGIWRSVSTTLGEALLPALKVVGEFLQKNSDTIKTFVPVLTMLAVGLAIAAAAQWVMNSALLANPITWIILAVVALVAAIVYLATQTTFFQDIWDAVWKAAVATWNWFWDLLKKGWDLLVYLFMNWTGPGLLIKHWETIKNAFMTGVNWVVDKVNWFINMMIALWNWFSNLPGMILGYFNQMNMWVANKINEMIEFVKSIPGRVIDAVGNLNNLLADAGKKVIDGFINGIKAGFNKVKDVLGDLTDMLPDWKGPMAVDKKILFDSGTAVLDGFNAGLASQIPDVQKTLNGVTSNLPGWAGNVAMSNTTSSSLVGSNEVHLVIDGADSEFTNFFRKVVRNKGGGSITNYSAAEV